MSLRPAFASNGWSVWPVALISSTRWGGELLLRERCRSRFAPVFQQRLTVLAEVTSAARRGIWHVVTNESLPLDQVVCRRIHLVGAVEVEPDRLGGPISRVVARLRIERAERVLLERVPRRFHRQGQLSRAQDVRHDSRKIPFLGALGERISHRSLQRVVSPEVLDPQNVHDRRDHADRRVLLGDHCALLHVRSGNERNAPMRIHVVWAVLRVVLDYEHQGIAAIRLALRYLLNDPADRVIIVRSVELWRVHSIDGVNTPELDTADNDYAVGRIVEKVAKSKAYSGNTLVFVIEDDAQDGPDHVDAHRSIAFVAGPYVKQGAVVSQKYTTVSMIATIVDILGIEHLGTYDALERPMTDAFSKSAKKWDFTAIVPDILRTTQLPLPVKTARNSLKQNALSAFYAKPRHDAAYWTAKTVGFNFDRAEQADAPAYNLVQWHGHA